MNPLTIGDQTESRVLAALLQVYPTVLVPFGTKRFDFVFQNEAGEFHTVQSKTGRYRNGSILFNAYSLDHKTGKKRLYHGEVEFFGVACPDFGEVYLVPVSEAKNTECALRIDQPKNGQTKNIRWAKDYLLFSPC